MRTKPGFGAASTTPGELERRGYIALALIPGMGARTLAALMSAYGSAAAILRASVRPAAAREERVRVGLRLAADVSLDTADHVMRRCERDGIQVLTPHDADFPAALRSIPFPPVLLFAQGDLALLARPAAAVVGSRDPTPYGRDVAAMLADALGRSGIAVVSGMARGLDAVAHEAALDAGGPTIGILGNGIGVVYPAANRALYERMATHGLLLTEHPPGERPTAGSFPRRNRLISGLAPVVVVVEAARGSGTLVTVAAALEQGRDVMAVPGPITSPKSEGTNQLIRDGAEPVLGPAELLAKFSVTHVAPPPIATDQPSLSPDEAQVFHAMDEQPRHVDDLAVATGLPISTLLGVLSGLELGGLVEQLPGALFRRATVRHSGSTLLA